MIKIYSYEEMEKSELQQDVLEEMRHFSYVRFDSFEGFDCLSLEILDYENLLFSKGSILLYLEKDKVVCFTSKKETMEAFLSDLLNKGAEDRLIYIFLNEITQMDQIAFERIEKEIMELEQALIVSGKSDCVSEIIDLRKRLMVLKKFYEQMLNALDTMIENENSIFNEKSIRSFKMLYRRFERRFQNVLNLRECVTQVRESYEAEVDISLNTTMKIFTVVTTIFLPLTLIVGWYGMNFDMPEYGWDKGYLFVSVISVIFLLAGILFFRKKKWF